eukprot:TRINITY_DN5029_c0_g1_i5.p2 TRINITY_DN5029_c0_g1~~TRINITY_DN5029_c0_g1_i5.p2  ORF type:complete len:133 (+),score=34.26 TRINITY_DN5029_c0_g1_i5:109-507(+)
MLPYFMIFPFWILAAFAYPAFESLHALQEKSPRRKTWLCYWVSYVVGLWFLYYFEWFVSIPFVVFSFYVDLYYEAQLLLMLYLVSPWTMGIDKVEQLAETNANKFGAELKKCAEDAATSVMPKVRDFFSQCT